MKTLMLRVCYLGLAVTTILASPGNEEPTKTTEADPVADVLEPLKIVDADALAESAPPAPLAQATQAGGDTNAPAPVVPVQEPVAPPNVKLSPALAEVVRLVQAGVSTDVLLAYITNSAAVFNIDSEAIVYLNDLGVTNSVITALIQQDSSPGAAARKASLSAAQPLPPGVAATAPVTNLYPPSATRTFPAAGQTSYPGDFSSVTDTNAQATNLPAAVAEAPPAGDAPVVTAPLSAPTESVTINHFYSSLSPYGSWVDVDGYGLCWRPTVAVADPYWQPYSHRGRWLWSDAGWYWYSDYSWGWAPFHYGRWCSYPRLGWIWVPGTVWAPAWVTWRYTDSYCGWAPLPPGCGYRSGIGLTWYGRGVSIGFDFGLASHCWSYVPVSRFCDWNVRRHCLPEHRLHVVHRTATPHNRFSHRNGTIVNHGIEPNTIAKASRTKIPTVKIKDAPLPAGRNAKPERLDSDGKSLALVRPQIPKSAPSAAVKPAVARGARPKTVAVSSPAQPKSVPPASGLAAARPNAQTPPMTAVREQGTAKRHAPATMAPPNSGVRAETPNRTAPTQQSPQPQASQPAARPQVTQPRPHPAQPRQQSTPAPRQNVTTPRNNAVATPPPATRNAAPSARPTPTPQSRPAPSVQARNNNMIRSFAEPQRSVPNAIARPTPAPQPRVQVPMASAQPAPRQQHFSAPRPSVSAPVRSAPPATRSVPNSGGGNRGNGGGGRNRGGD